MTRRAFVWPMRSSSSPRSLGNLGGRRPVSQATLTRQWQRDKSAPAAARRGPTVSSKSSSAVSKIIPPASTGCPSGSGRPLLTRAARSKSTVLFPIPGSPSNMVILSAGIQPGHNQRTARAATSASPTKPSSAFISGPVPVRDEPSLWAITEP